MTLFTERMEGKKILGLETIVEEETSEDKRTASSSSSKPQQIAPLPEAENFEEINELAEDQQKALSPIISEHDALPSSSLPVVPKLEEPQIISASSFNADDLQVVPFDGRQILKFSRLSAAPSLLNATGRSFSRYSVLRKLRPKKRSLHNKQISPVENQIESFFSRLSSSLTAPSPAAARLKLSLINLNSASASSSNSTNSGKKSQRFKELEDAFEEVKAALKEFREAHPQTPIHLPENSHFHPLSITSWEEAIIWSPDENTDVGNSRDIGMYINISASTSGVSPQPSSKPSTGPSTASASSSAGAQPVSAGPSLSSILSSLSLSGSGIGGDSATATALLALIRNQHMQRSSSQSSMNSSSSSLRATTPIMTRSPSLVNRNPPPPQLSLKFPKSKAARILNRSVEEDDWTDSIIWDPKEVDASKLQTHLILPLDDPQLVFTAQSADHLSKKLSRAEKLIAKRLKKLRTPNGSTSESIASYSRPLPDKFNISNDKYYESAEASGSASASSTAKAPEVAKIQATTTSSSSSSISAAVLGLSSSVPALQHSVPALKLSSPAFQTCRTKRELRLWHRPRLSYPAGFEIDSWARVKCAVKKATNGLSVNEMIGSVPATLHVNQSGGVIRSFKKLSLRDSSRFLLLEYSVRTCAFFLRR